MIFVGASGTGLTNTDRELDAGDIPDAFVAVVVNVYDVPFVRPVTIIGLVVPVAVIPPGLEVMVYEIAYKEYKNVIDTEPENGITWRFVGVRGTGLTNTGDDGLDIGDVPDAFVAVIVNV